MGFNKYIYMALFFSLSSTANESLCIDEAEIIFQCETKSGKIISICGEEERVIYKYGFQEMVELELSSDVYLSKQSFSGWNEAMVFSFNNNKYDYHVYGLYTQDLNKYDLPSFKSGVYVEKNKVGFNSVECKESVGNYIVTDEEVDSMYKRYSNFRKREFDDELWFKTPVFDID